MHRSLRRAAAAGSTALATALTAVTLGSAAGAAPEVESAAGAVSAQTCSEGPVTAGYYRMWRDVATTKPEDREPNVQRFDDVPAEVDIVSAFATTPENDPEFWEEMRSTYLPNLHEQGTEVVFTLWIDDVIDDDTPLTQAGYDAAAQELYDTYIEEWGLDGLDIDVERKLSGDDLTRATGILTALGERIGPRSGTDTLFIYDTNLTGNEPLFQAVAPSVEYVFLQAYGRGASTLQGTWETFAPYISSCQFLPGFSFYEENGHEWGDVRQPLEDSRAADYARWQPEGGEKGGVFGYAIDRDGKAEGDDTITRTDFSWMRQLDGIQQGAGSAR